MRTRSVVTVGLAGHGVVEWGVGDMSGVVAEVRKRARRVRGFRVEAW